MPRTPRPSLAASVHHLGQAMIAVANVALIAVTVLRITRLSLRPARRRG